MTLKELGKIRREWLDLHLPYSLTYWDKFNYKILENILYRKKAGRGDNSSYNDVIIMCDTETSKERENPTISDKNGTIKYVGVVNYIVAWTISLRAFDRNIVTLYGNDPEDFTKCIQKIIGSMNGYETIFYWHNMSYDWTFCRRFMFDRFGYPSKQLNTKSHYPILIQWDNGITFKDSLILAQRSLDKWAKDLQVDTKKALGKWDYNKIRHQHEDFTPEELEYIEHDTLAGVECIDKLKNVLGKSLYSMPYTATGIPREDVRVIGKVNHARDMFQRLALPFDLYIIMEKVFHGGFTHANRHYINANVDWDIVKCKDFSSSYPFIVLSEKFPMEGFNYVGDQDTDFILDMIENEYACVFKLTMVKPQLRDDRIDMPVLQRSKIEDGINLICDNGRVLKADYISIWICEMDFKLIMEQYECMGDYLITDVYIAKKHYLPRWFTDYIFGLYTDKTKLKGVDDVLYALAKAKLNAAAFGMCAQKAISDEINEVYTGIEIDGIKYESGEYYNANTDPQILYDKYLKNHNKILPYQWCCWITAYAMYNLHTLGKCVSDDGIWLYSDTDSIYATKWDEDKVTIYNDSCKEKLRANGYGCVYHNDKEYWLGVAEDDGAYSEFKTQGAKRYCGRSIKDGELHITIAGVPKSAATLLSDDINNFAPGFVFKGTETGKLTHTYNYISDIYTNEYGDKIGDYIDLTPCDYLLDSTDVVDFEGLLTEEIEIQIYE